MSNEIFINYRRGDDPGFTRALYLRLEQEFSSDRIFMDVEGQIAPGDDFVEVITRQVIASKLLLIIIGPRWIELLNSRRMDDDDFVQLEIEAALEHGKRIIPVLVGNARMPSASELPRPIAALARRNAIEVRPERFGIDSVGLCNALKALLSNPAPASSRGGHGTDVAIEPLPVIRRAKVTDSRFAHQISMQSTSLRRILSKLLFAMSSDPARMYLNGIYLHPARGSDGGAALRLVATDGHRLAVIEVTEEAGLSQMPGVILPRDAAFQIYATLETMDGDVGIGVNSSELKFQTHAGAFIFAPIDGTYPEYARVFPRGSAAIARLHRKSIIDSLDSLFLGGQHETESLTLLFSPGRLMIKVDDQSAAFADIEYLAGTGDLAIGFNRRYLHDILRRMESDYLDVRLDGATAAASFHEPRSNFCTYVLMPVKI